MSLFEYIGKRIKTLRTNFGTKGISQDRLAKAVGVAPNTVSRWETATYRPSVEDLVNLSRFFGISVGDFFPGKSAKPEQLPDLLAIVEYLKPEDVEKLKSYAEFLRAQSLQPRKGRKRNPPLRDFWKNPGAKAAQTGA